MSSTIYNPIIEQGADWEVQFVVKSAQTGAAMDLTGFTGKLQVRVTADNSTALASITTTSSADGVINVGAAGLLKWRITGAKTKLFPAGQVVYDIKLVAPDLSVMQPVKGIMTVAAGVTKL